jgi:ATP-dependent Lhr-like helicase
MALSARLRDERGLDPDAIWSDDGVILHLPDADEPPPSELAMLDPAELEELVTAELGNTALFGSRFREAAARSLLIPRRMPDRRTPLWQQRLKAQGLLQVARNFGQFPVVLETYRECLQDWLDLPALKTLLEQLERREVALVDVETQTASPFAQSLLFDYIATYMYEGDAPRAEQRAAALALDRDLLRELLGAEELRELIDPDALASVEEDLQLLRPTSHAADADQLHDVLRSLGDLSDAELQARVVPGLDAQQLVARLVSERRAVKVRLAGEQRWIDAGDAGLYRDALGAVPPAGLPERFLEAVDGALAKLLRRYARTHGPFTTAEVVGRYGLPEQDAVAALSALERGEELVRGEIRPLAPGAGREREWCDPEVLRRLRRASIAALRREIEPTDQAALARFAVSWHGIDRYARSGAKAEGERMPLDAAPDRLREVLAPLQGLALTPETWERDVLPRRLGTYDRTWLDRLCAAGEVVWTGAGSGSGRGGRVALYFREDAPFLGPPQDLPEHGPRSPVHDALRERLAAGAAFWSDLLVDLDHSPVSLRDTLWDLVWSGEVTNDAFAPLRARRLSLAPPAQRPGRRRRFGSRHPGSQPQLQGRWSLTRGLFEPRPSEKERAQARADLLLERHGLVARETVVAERIPGGFSSVYAELTALETLGSARRGYFVEGLGGAQFALSAAVERLRSHRDARAEPVVLAAQDPANLYGAVLPWPRREEQARRPARVPGAYVVLLGGQALLYVESGGRGLVSLADHPEEWLPQALDALADFVRSGGPLRRLAVERFDGEPVMGSAVEPLLVGRGFRPGPRKLVLSA